MLPDVSFNTSYSLSAIYAGSITLRSEINMFTIAPRIADVIIATDGNITPGETITITANVSDSNQALDRGIVVFKLNGKSLKDDNGNFIYATVVDGIATINYTIPANYSAKDYTLSAVYSSSGYERSESDITLTIAKRITSIYLSDITVGYGENTHIKITIVDESGSPIMDVRKIAVKINYRTIIQMAVGGVVDLELSTSSLSTGTYIITVVAGENSCYNRSESALTLTVTE